MFSTRAPRFTILLMLCVGCSEPSSDFSGQQDPSLMDQATPSVDAELMGSDGSLSPDALIGSDGSVSPDALMVVDAGEMSDASDTLDQNSNDASAPPQPASCESACAALVDCLISQCIGFSRSTQNVLSRRCLAQCTPLQADTFTTQTCEENIAQLREEQSLVANACPQTDGNGGNGGNDGNDGNGGNGGNDGNGGNGGNDGNDGNGGNGEGLNMLYIGHSFGRNFADRLPQFASSMGIENHRSTIVFSGGGSGAPLALWENDAKRTATQDILDGGEIDLMVMICCSVPWLDNGDDPGIVNWINYALEQNPNTSFGLAMPWVDFPESYETAAEYSALWDGGYGIWLATVNALRLDFPDVEIFAIPHGRAAGDLRTLFEMDQLPEVQQLRGQTNTSIFTDAKGHAGQILKDFGALIWLGSIYGIDVSDYPFEGDYVTALGRMANTIVSQDTYTRQP